MWETIRAKLDSGGTLTVDEAEVAAQMALFVPLGQRPDGWVSPMELPDEPPTMDDRIAHAVELIRGGGKLEPGLAADLDDETIAAVVRYANGLPSVPTEQGQAAWLRVAAACDPTPAEPDHDEPDAFAELAARAEGMTRALVYATEFLIAASTPDLAERIGSLIGVAMVVDDQGFATGPDTSRRLLELGRFVVGALRVEEPA